MCPLSAMLWFLLLLTRHTSSLFYSLSALCLMFILSLLPYPPTHPHVIQFSLCSFLFWGYQHASQGFSIRIQDIRKDKVSPFLSCSVVCGCVFLSRQSYYCQFDYTDCFYKSEPECATENRSVAWHVQDLRLWVCVCLSLSYTISGVKECVCWCAFDQKVMTQSSIRCLRGALQSYSASLLLPFMPFAFTVHL